MVVKKRNACLAGGTNVMGLDTKRKTCRFKRVERPKIKTLWRTIEIVKGREKSF